LFTVESVQSKVYKLIQDNKKGKTMFDFCQFLNKYLFIDYSPVHQYVYSLVTKIEEDEIHLIISRDFEKTGLLIDDVISCRVSEGDCEYYFKSRITGIDIRSEGLTLIIKPETDVEQFINARVAKRINLRIMAFTEKKQPASIINISRRGLLLETKKQYKKKDLLDIKVLLSYPSRVCSLTGEVVRLRDTTDDRYECGISIKDFSTSDDENKYLKFIMDLEKAFQ